MIAHHEPHSKPSHLSTPKLANSVNIDGVAPSGRPETRIPA